MRDLQRSIDGSHSRRRENNAGEDTAATRCLESHNLSSGFNSASQQNVHTPLPGQIVIGKHQPDLVRRAIHRPVKRHNSNTGSACSR